MEAKDQNPRFSTARLSLAKTLFDLHRYADAADELVHMLNNTSPRESVRELAVVKIAECLDKTERSGACLEFCNEHLQRFPNNLGLKRIRAQNLVDVFVIGNVQDGVPVVERSSLEFFETICDDKKLRTPSDVCYLARLYEWMGKLPEAVELLNEAQVQSPDFWEPSFDLGVLHWRQGKFENALPLLFKSSRLAPWKSQPLLILSKVYEALGQMDDVISTKNRLDNLEQQIERLYE